MAALEKHAPLAFLAIKYHADCRNRALIEAIDASVAAAGWQSRVVLRDLEDWGEKHFSAPDLMLLSFKMLSQCQLCLIEISEKGVGVGIEAGYAYAHNLPVVIIARIGSDIPETLKGIARTVIFYNEYQDLEQLTHLLENS